MNKTLLPKTTQSNCTYYFGPFLVIWVILNLYLALSQKWNLPYIKACVIFYIFIFNQMIALQKLWKTFFILSKKLFSFLRHSNFSISIFPIIPFSQCFRDWSKINLKVYDVINCLNKNLINILFDIFGKKKCMTLKICPLIDVINCLNKNLINILFDIFGKKKCMTLKICPLIDVINCLNENLINILFDIFGKKKCMTLKICPLIEY